MAVKLSTIAKQANVSVSLVSRVLNDDPTLQVRADTRARVLDTWKRLQPKNSAAAQRLVRTRAAKDQKRLTRHIVLPVPRVFGTVFREPESEHVHFYNELLVQVMQKRLQEEGFRVSIQRVGREDTPRALREMYLGSSRFCDGVVLLTAVMTSEIAEAVRELGMPHVVTARRGDMPYDLTSVSTNHLEGARLALEHLRGLGHERIGMVIAGQMSDRLRSGVRLALAYYELPFHERWCWFLPDTPRITASYSALEISQAAELVGDWPARWLRMPENDRPTALFCQNDMTAFGVIEAMRAHGLEPGRDISIIGDDNIQLHGGDVLPESHEYNLTTLDNPAHLRGRRAAELLINQIVYGQCDIVHETVPKALAVRSTTGPSC